MFASNVVNVMAYVMHFYFDFIDSFNNIGRVIFVCYV